MKQNIPSNETILTIITWKDELLKHNQKGAQVAIRPLKQVAPHLPTDLCILIDHALSLDPNDRPKNARVFYNQLQKIKLFLP